MNYSRKVLWVIIFILSFGFSNVVMAQFIIEQMEYKLPVNYDLLPENIELDDFSDEAKYFLGLPEDKLKQSILEQGDQIEVFKSTIFMDMNHFALEMETAEEGKITAIMDPEKEMFYYVLWSQKRVFEMSKTEMEGMKKQAESAANDMLKHLPPEMQKQAREAMKMEQSRNQSSGQVKSTGKKMKKYGYNCEQYIMESEEEVIIIWAAEDVHGLTSKAKVMYESLSNLMDAEDEEKDEWDLVEGKVPVEVRTYRMGMMSDPVIDIRAITKIQETKPPSEKFVPPGKKDGFKTGTMQEMMMEMMPSSEDY